MSKLIEKYEVIEKYEIENLGEKAKNFIIALDELCASHKVCLSVSQYDSLEIWNLNEQDKPIHANGIIDKTE